MTSDAIEPTPDPHRTALHTAATVRAIVAAHLIRETQDIASSDRLVSDLGADSLDIEAITMDLEKAFDVDVTPCDLRHVSTVEDLSALIWSKRSCA